MKQLALSVFYFFISVQSVSAGPFEAGVSALERNHYATAMRAWMDLARAGAPKHKTMSVTSTSKALALHRAILRR